MQKRTFSLKPGTAYIELVKLLKIEQISQTGGHGKLLIEEGNIRVNGEEEFRKRRKLYNGDVVNIESVQIEIVS